jgi:hypothetical protein
MGTADKHDPWALLREAKRLIAANRLMLGHYSGVREVGSLEDSIDAALAERQDKPPCSCGQPYPCMKGCPDCCHSQGYLDYCQGDRHAERQDSATPVVESEVEWDRVNAHFYTAYPDNETNLIVCRFDLTRQEWRWDMEREIKRKGYCATQAEAKSAAIAAARGMR